MPQINSGKSPPWVSGEIVTAAGLNGMIDSATLDPSAITAQSNFTTLTGDEYTMIVDPVTGLLKKTQLKNALLTGQNISTGFINNTIGGVTIEGNTEINLDAPTINLDNHATAGSSIDISTDQNIDLVTANGNIFFNAPNGDISFGSDVTIPSIKGVTNFEDGLQIDGSSAYVFLGVVEETIPIDATNVGTGWTTKWTSASYTKPAGEVWIVETTANYSYNIAWYVAGRMLLNSSTTTLDAHFDIQGGGMSYVHHDRLNYKYVFDSASTFTSTFKLEFMASSASCPHILGVLTFQTPPFLSGVSLPASKLRITKFKAS